MSSASPANDSDQMGHTSLPVSRPPPSSAPNPTSSSSPSSSAFPSALSRPGSASLATASGLLSMANNPVGLTTSNYDLERSTLRLGDLEPWMDEAYILQVADLMRWRPVSVRIPTPHASIHSSPALHSTSRQPPLSDPPSNTAYQTQQPNNPGHLFLTFPTAADAASVLAQLHAANAAQSRGGRSPIRLPNSERLMDLAYASPSDSVACWTYHLGMRRGEGRGIPMDSRSSSSGAGHGGSEGGSRFTESEVAGRAGETSTAAGAGAILSGSKTSASPHSATSSAAIPTNGSGTGPAAPNPQPSSAFLGTASPSSHNYPTPLLSSTQIASGAQQSRAQEFSIFVGDLGPDVTHSDLVALFRDPTKGLRADRPTRKIKAFDSCKSAKIMLDASTGLSRGYGFVRFGDEADQRRALIEMQGMYCLSRPIRISHATAKAKTPGDVSSEGLPGTDPYAQASTPPGGDTLQMRSVSTPMAIGSQVESSGRQDVERPTSSLSQGDPRKTGPLNTSSSGLGPILTINDIPPALLAQIASLATAGRLGEYLAEHHYRFTYPLPTPDPHHDLSPGGGDANVPTALQEILGSSRDTPVMDLPAAGSQGAAQGSVSSSSNQPEVSDITRDVMKSLSPNAGQGVGMGITGNSSDPYNTTVFVGGLSALISEDTLRSFFAPFGEIHYVKIPPGKGCGFVQFVHKQDANKAIDRMQGFAIGGSKIRLSWGRSQYRAAVAAAQATQLGLNMGELQSLSDASGGALPDSLLGTSAATSPAPSLDSGLSAPPSLKLRDRAEPLPAPIPGRAVAFEHFPGSPSPPPIQAPVQSHGQPLSSPFPSTRGHELRGLGIGSLSGGSSNPTSVTSIRGGLGSGQFAPFSPDIRGSSNMQLGPPPGLDPLQNYSSLSLANPTLSTLPGPGFGRSGGGSIYEQQSFDDVFASIGSAGRGSFDSNRIQQISSPLGQTSFAPSSYRSQQIFESISAAPRGSQTFASNAFGNQGDQPLSSGYGSTSPFGHSDNRQGGISLYDSHDSSLGIGGLSGVLGPRNPSYGLGSNASQSGVPYRRDYGASPGDPSSLGRQ